jgi:hypothetical protein
MDLKEIGNYGVDYFHLAYRPLAGSCDIGDGCFGSIKDREFLFQRRTFLAFLRRPPLHAIN